MTNDELSEVKFFEVKAGDKIMHSRFFGPKMSLWPMCENREFHQSIEGEKLSLPISRRKKVAKFVNRLWRKISIFISWPGHKKKQRSFLVA